MDAIIGPPWLTRRLLHPIAKGFDPMPLQVVGVTWLVLLQLLMIGKRNSLPTVLTVRQYFQNDDDQHLILIIDGAFCAGHPSNSTKKSLVRNYGNMAKRQVSGDATPALQLKGWRYCVKIGWRL